MKNRYFISALTLTALALTGCGTQPITQADNLSSAETTTTSATTATVTEATETTTSGTELTTTTAATVTTESTTAATTTLGTLFTVLKPAETVKSGDGGEEHADEPYPPYFNYVFAKDSVTMRLTGGNYQVLQFDFSQMDEEKMQKEFYLYDCNFDEHPDLVAPYKTADDKTSYAIFLWDDGVKKFSDTAVKVDNPTFSAAKKTFTSIQQLTPQTLTITGYRWQGAAPVTAFIVYADYRSLTASYKDLSSNQTTQKTYDSADALAKAVSSYQS